MHLAAEKYRQEAQFASSDPSLAKEINAVAADMQNISTTLASGMTPSAAQYSQLATDEDAFGNALYALCDPGTPPPVITTP
jgi:hypothetical protein